MSKTSKNAKILAFSLAFAQLASGCAIQYTKGADGKVNGVGLIPMCSARPDGKPGECPTGTGYGYGYAPVAPVYLYNPGYGVGGGPRANIHFGFGHR